MSCLSKAALVGFILISYFPVSAQNGYSGKVKLQSGTVIEFQHFGLLTCGGKTHTLGKNQEIALKVTGTLNSQEFTVEEYENVKQMLFYGFTDDPKSSAKSIDQGTIVIKTRDNSTFKMTDAKMENQCYKKGDMANIIRIQGQNPITKKPEEIKVATNKISEISFN